MLFLLFCVDFNLYIITENKLKNYYYYYFKQGKRNSRHFIYQFLKFMLGCRFSSEAYAKNEREKETKCSLKTNDVLLGADGHVLT